MRDRRRESIRWSLILGTICLGCSHAEGPAPEPSGRVDAVASAPVSPAVAVVLEVAPVEADPPPVEPLQVKPASATIGSADAGVQLLLTNVGEASSTPVRWGVEPSGVVAVDDRGYVRPISGGSAEVWAEAAGSRASATIEVAERSDRPWDFAADVVPVFTRFGCNSGGCHGKAGGQNGFHLSLFGYDPTGDYAAIVREDGGRRVDRLNPGSSLLLRKASGQVSHAGGVRLAPGSDSSRLLAAWVAAGVPISAGESPGPLAEIRVEPKPSPMSDLGTRQLRVVARYEGGHERDVTRLATYTSNDDLAAEVDEQGLATLSHRGEADLIVRYGSEVRSYRLSAAANPGLEYDFTALPRANFIDALLYERLAALELPPSPPVDDPGYLRRVTLDLTGQIPTPEATRRFVADDDPEKRSKVVDELMTRPEFFDFWRLKFGDMLQISRARFNDGAGPYQGWLTDQLKSNRPWDEMVRELLTALGDPRDPVQGGPVNYAVEGNGDPKIQAELTAQRFLGLRMRCAQCHDHPFDIWTQDDYYGLAAVFAKVRLGAGDSAMMARPTVGIDPSGSVEHLRTKQTAAPRLLDGTPIEVSEGDDPRVAFAAWATSAENPYFARAMANWAWAQFFGKGIADPPDDLSAANPPVLPELLDALASDFAASGFDLRHLIRAIATSNAYAVDSAPIPENASDHRLFSHHLPRPLTAHQMADAISQATNVPEYFPGLGRQARRKAVEIFDPGTPSPILDAFGRCPRTSGCSPVASPSLSLAQALLLIGGGTIDDKVMHLNGYLSNLLALDPPPSPGEIVEFLYYRTLCRPPSVAERTYWADEITSASETPDGLQGAAEDLFWALLNSREFAFNH